MYVLLSKLALLLISPLNWIVIVIVWRLISKSPVIQKRLNIFLIVLVMFFGNAFIHNRLVYAWQVNEAQINNQQQYSAGIVLGGFVSFDKGGKGFFNAASDRMIAVSTLYKTGRIKKIIISAGTIEANKPKEANYIFNRMLQLGIPAEDLVIENESKNTFENAKFSKEKIDSLKLPPPYILVTSAMHMRRSLQVFKKAGISVVPYPCNYEVLDQKLGFTDFIVPRFYLYAGWTNFMKEVFGLIVYKALNRA